MFYRRYGRIADLEKREMSGFITFRQFVQRDTSFYALSRQIADSRQPSKSKKQVMLAELREHGTATPSGALGNDQTTVSEEEPVHKPSPPPRGLAIRPPPKSSGLRQLTKPSPRGNWRSHTGRPTRAQEKVIQRSARQNAKQAEMMAALNEAQVPDWKSLTKDELAQQARAEALAMLESAATIARERSRKASDMTNPSGLIPPSAPLEETSRLENGKLTVPVFPEIIALQSRIDEANGSEKPLSWQDGVRTLHDEAAIAEYRPPSRIMYGHHGLRQPMVAGIGTGR